MGEKFNKDHSTVISSVRKIEAQKQHDDQLKGELAEITGRLGVAES